MGRRTAPHAIYALREYAKLSVIGQEATFNVEIFDVEENAWISSQILPMNEIRIYIQINKYKSECESIGT